MPRGGGRSSGRSSSPNRSSYNTRSTAQATRPPVSNTPPMQGQSGGMLGGIGSTIMTGMAFGGGSAIGHSVVGSMMGGGRQHDQKDQMPVEGNNNTNTQQNVSPCQSFNLKFVECLKMSNNEISQCQSIFDDLKICEKSLKI
jgi:hypothetical protein